VSTASYFPYCFFNLASPILDVLYGFVGFKVPAATPATPEREGEQSTVVEAAPVRPLTGP
jgi:NhaC family Na+:H+ antiporter